MNKNAINARKSDNAFHIQVAILLNTHRTLWKIFILICIYNWKKMKKKDCWKYNEAEELLLFLKINIYPFSCSLCCKKKKNGFKISLKRKIKLSCCCYYFNKQLFLIIIYNRNAHARNKRHKGRLACLLAFFL